MGDITALGNLIGTLGFPIVMSILLFMRMGEQDKQHKDEMMKLTESLNNNTIAITKLTDKLKLGEEP